MGSPSRVAIRAAPTLEAGEMFASRCAAAEMTCAGSSTKTMSATPRPPLLVDVLHPQSQSLSWYLESSLPPTPCLPKDSSDNSTFTSFLLSANTSSCLETFDYQNIDCLARPCTVSMADADDIPPTSLVEEAAIDLLAVSPTTATIADDSETLFSPILSSQISEPSLPRDYDLEEGLFGDAIGIYIPQAEGSQYSVDTPLSTSLSSKFSHFPAFGKKRKHKKDAGCITTQFNTPESRPVSKMRSQSFTSGVGTAQGLSSFASMSVLSSPTKLATLEAISPVSPLDLNRFWFDSVAEPVERTKFTSTPLLPPCLDEFETEDEMDARISSPFLSSAIGSSRALSVASSNSEMSCAFPMFDHYSITGSICEGPMHSSSSRRDTQYSSADFLPSPPDPSTIPLKKQDEWSSKLGHFNFTIEPEPYLPEERTAAAYEKLVSDWEVAKVEYVKQQERTLRWYGPNSKAFKLTQEKWSFIEGQWRKNEQELRTKAIASGEKLPGRSTEESSANSDADQGMVLPSIRIPHLDGKFPKLQDMDIVGPLSMDPPRQPRSRAVSPTRMVLSGGTGWKLARFFGRVA